MAAIIVLAGVVFMGGLVTLLFIEENKIKDLKSENAKLRVKHEETITMSMTEAVTSAIVEAQQTGQSIEDIIKVDINGRPVTFIGAEVTYTFDFTRSYIQFKILQFKDDDGKPKLPYKGDDSLKKDN